MSPTLAAVARDADGVNRRARERALAAAAQVPVDVTGLVAYSSSGRLLVVGDDPQQAAQAAGRWAPQSAAVLLIGQGGGPLSGVTTWWSGRDEVDLSGWLGDFRLRLPAQGAGEERFDLVLDLGEPPLLAAELPPPGYIAPGEAGIGAALQELAELVGEFEKPRYFRYDPDVCAHGMKGTTACRRCIDACPAGAITGLVDRVRVESHLCQGGGACAAACPTGAMTYRYPTVEDTLSRVRRLLTGYREAGGGNPVLLIHDAGAGAERVERLLGGSDTPAGHLLPLAVEEVASLGLEAWLSALACGARAVRLVGTPAVPAKSRRELDEQMDFGRAVLAGLGYGEGALAWLEDDPASLEPVMPEIEPARHAALGGKRQILFAALDHLLACAERPRPLASLPAGAPFGTAEVDAKACTLCMACVTVCPGKALMDGQDVPQLRFLEANCVQCGLCTRSCPEDAIWITPRMLFDAEARGRPRLLREDSPFHCVGCGKAFATTSVIGRMQQRLAGHSMFQGPNAMRRLQMCGDCRVADMMREQEI
jgi:ferredoxin